MNKKILFLLAVVLLLCTVSAAFGRGTYSDRDAFYTYLGKSRSEAARIGPKSYRSINNETEYVDYYSNNYIYLGEDYDLRHGVTSLSLMLDSETEIIDQVMVGYFFGLTNDYDQQFEDAMMLMGLNPYKIQRQEVISTFLGKVQTAKYKDALCGMYAIPAFQAIVCGGPNDDIVGAIDFIVSIFGNENMMMEMLHNYYEVGNGAEIKSLEMMLNEGIDVEAENNE